MNKPDFDHAVAVDRIATRFFAKHNQFRTESDTWGGYPLILTLEALLAVDRCSGQKQYLPRVLEFLNMRGRTSDNPTPGCFQSFCNLAYPLYETTGDKTYVQPVIEEATRLQTGMGRSPEGAVGHKISDPGRHLLIDYLQEYSSLLARAAALGADPAFFEECVRQYEIYRGLLEDRKTGLWRQGRGWLEDPMQLSPGAWSRGHGWLIRGLVSSMDCMRPGSSHFLRLQRILIDLADALLRVQDQDGMWHQLLDHPFDDSFPESSGTGLIAYELIRAYEKGFLVGECYREAGRRAIRHLRHFVRADGAVLGACPGPGPLTSIDAYFRTEAPIDDPHGIPALLFAFAFEGLAV